MPSRIRAHRTLEQSCHTPPQGVKIISSNRVYESTCITGHSYSAPESQEVVRTEFHDTDMFSYKGLSNMVPASAENVVTGSKPCSGNPMDLCCCINVWASRAGSVDSEVSWK